VRKKAKIERYEKRKRNITEQKLYKELLTNMQVTDTSLEDEYNRMSIELYTEAIEYYKAALTAL